MTACHARLADGRLHFQHGPIDLIIQAGGEAAAVSAAEDDAATRFAGVLEALVAELPCLRANGGPRPAGAIAQAMADAVAPFRPPFITPMAAVAGAVADTIIAAFRRPGIRRAYVNNGGDIAVYLAPGQSLTAAIAARPGSPDRVNLTASGRSRGLATSGWRGRSHSRGIADAVTVLAPTAAMADAAATVIANAVDLPRHPAISRRRACDLRSDSDLGARLVTVGVGRLTATDRTRALEAGLAAADAALSRGLIDAAALFLQGEVRTAGPAFLIPSPEPETCIG